MTEDLFSVKNDLLSALEPVSLTDKEPNDFTVVINGSAVHSQSGRVRRAIDTVADAFTASLRWDPSNAPLAELLVPYGYQLAECYLGKDIAIYGMLFNQKNRFTRDGVFKELEAFSLPVDIIDVNCKPPFEQTKVTLEDRIKKLTEPFGFKVVFELDDDEPFDRVTSSPNDKIFDHLLSLAQQRGALLTSTSLGELLVTKANVTGSPVDSITEELPPATEYTIEFNGRERFGEYQARAQSPGRRNRSKSKLKVASAFDTVVPEYRFMSFNADDTTMGNIQKAADWRRSKEVARALTIPIPVYSWYDKNGKLWKENTIVTVKSDSLQIPDGYNFLIRAVDYIFSRDGTPAILSVVPPQVYTGEEIKEPWGVPSAGFLENFI